MVKMSDKLRYKLLYALSDLLIKIGMWLDSLGYSITQAGIQLDYDLMKKKFKWQK